MIRSVLAFVGAMALTTTSQIHAPEWQMPAVQETYVAPAVLGAAQDGAETLTVYYTPLASTEVSKYLGFGIAYHMAIVYSDAAKRSYGASSRPSNLRSAMTPGNAFNAVLYMASEQPSSFGTLIADPRNNTMFVKGSAGDFYTKDNEGHDYPHSLVLQGKNLSAQWSSILTTYTNVGKLGLTYSPMSQNSNSLAGTALRRANIGLDFSSDTYFAPGRFTTLPDTRPIGG